MNTGNDCFACFMQQALTTVKLCTVDEALQHKVLVRIGGMFKDFSMDNAPPDNLAWLYRVISEMTDNSDPYAAIKQESNDFALGMEAEINEAIEQAEDPLLTAVRFAVGANVLDNGSQKQLDIHSTLAECQQQQFAVDHYQYLREKLEGSRRVLYLADNCGEIVFDKLLIRQLVKLGFDVTVAVRGMPVINDATKHDAEYCGIDKICRVISNGADAPGTSLAKCSEEFQDFFINADCILSKGMGNFESLSDTDAPIFFLLTVKCSTVLKYLQSLYTSAQLQIGSPVIVAPRFSL